MAQSFAATLSRSSLLKVIHEDDDRVTYLLNLQARDVESECCCCLLAQCAYEYIYPVADLEDRDKAKAKPSSSSPR